MDKEKVKVLVATPNYTNLMSSEAHTNHIECVSQWKQWGIDFSWTIVGRTFVHFARTQLCQIAVDGGFTHIFWIDDDAIVEPEMLPRFIDHDKDIMIAPYPMRKPPYEVGILSAVNYRCKDGHLTTLGIDKTPLDHTECETCGKEADRDFHDMKSYRNFKTSDLDRGIMQVDGGGTHAMLVKVSCFDKHGDNSDPITHPPELIKVMERMGEHDRGVIDHYIGDLPDESPSLREEDDAGKPFFLMPKSGTEDMLFCYRAKKKGIEVWCDTDVFAGHVGFYPVITRSFTEKMETIQMSPIALGDNQVSIVPASLGRDHNVVRAHKASNLA
tara:strand:- start:5193 stop:6176 length:984 start_codon:yes stop_codon:yes gene_type:complete